MNLNQFVTHLSDMGVIPDRDTFFTQDKDGMLFEWQNRDYQHVTRVADSWAANTSHAYCETRGQFEMFAGWHMRKIILADFAGLIPDLNEAKSAVHRDILDARTYIAKRDHAAEKSQEFTISLSEWLGLRSQTECPVTGVVLEFDTRQGENKIPDNKWTVDRVDPRKGYVPGNVIAMSFLANSAKGMVDSLITHRDLTTRQKLSLLNDAVTLLQHTFKEEMDDGATSLSHTESGKVHKLETEY